MIRFKFVDILVIKKWKGAPITFYNMFFKIKRKNILLREGYRETIFSRDDVYSVSYTIIKKMMR